MESKRAYRLADVRPPRVTPGVSRHQAANLLRYVRRVEAGFKLDEPATVSLPVLTTCSSLSIFDSDRENFDSRTATTLPRSTSPVR